MTWRAEKQLERHNKRLEEMVTLNKSWSGSTSLTISAVKETWQLHRVGCPFTGEGGRSRKPEDSRGKYKQLYTSGEELNLKGILICL